MVIECHSRISPFKGHETKARREGDRLQLVIEKCVNHTSRFQIACAEHLLRLCHDFSIAE